jgi:Flp pilus assembly protein TadG
MRNLRRLRRGGAAIEFALVAPVLLAVFGAMLELSLYVNSFHLISRAARDATRVGSITIEGNGADGSLIEANAIEHALTVLDFTGFQCTDVPNCDVTAEWAADPIDGNMYITTTIEYPYKGMTNLLPIVNQGVTARFTMLAQQQ